MKTVFVVFGTRPEAIKLAPFIHELKRREKARVLVVLSGQHREMLEEVLLNFDIIPDYNLCVMREGQSLSLLTARIVFGIEQLLRELCPDVVVVHGDTTTAFAASLAAFYCGIPTAHIEAGLRTRDIRNPFPEEFNRRAIALTARYHFAPTAMARDNLLSEGVECSRIYPVGNTVVDALGMTVRDDFRHILLDWVSGSRFLVVTAHRRENLGEPMRAALVRLRQVLDAYPDLKAIFPMHKNPAVRSVVTKVFRGCDNIRLVEPLDVFVFHNLLSRAYFVVSDSGGVQEEATALGKPLLLLRDITERPEGVATGVLKPVGASGEKLYECASLLLRDERVYASMAKASDVYGDGLASRRIADIVLQ